MNLDDRLRTAYQRQLDDVRERVDVEESAQRLLGETPARTGRVLLAAAAAILGVGGLLTVQNLDRFGSRAVELEAGTEGESTGAIDEADDGESRRPEPTVSVQTTRPLVPSAVEPPAGTEDRSRDESTPDRESPQRTTPGRATPDDTGDHDSSGTSTAQRPGPDQTEQPDSETVAVANQVCPTGYRAPLEWAGLRYVGDNRGWGRLDDLVDEQDGPFYFQAWEPGYPDPVMVEITPVEPVVVTEIRVAQDPFTPVDGDITVDIAGQEVSIGLDGTEGWRVHSFPQPTEVDRFVIGRSSATSNIMEVLLCVEPPS